MNQQRRIARLEERHRPHGRPAKQPDVLTIEEFAIEEFAAACLEITEGASPKLLAAFDAAAAEWIALHERGGA